MRRLLAYFRSCDSGQAMIFFAVLAPALFATAGIAIEGGRLFVEYRRTQAAADMAALVGAQKLPCATTDTSCIATAETQACSYATANGFSGCTVNGTSSSGATANVPPLSCSPYDFMDYGNGSGNASCKTTTAATYYSYIEVKLSDNLGNIPIFNTPVTLSAHAVAKQGPRTAGDFTIMTLDPSQKLSIQGNGTLVVTGSVFGQGGVQGNNKTDITCDGGWYSSNGTIAGVQTSTTGTPGFAPGVCTGVTNTTADTQTGFPQESDPYGGGSPPPVDGTFSNCTECTQAGWWYNDTTHVWTQGGNPTGSSIELFPGKYDSIYLGNSDHAYFNPGVYTFTGSYDTNHGAMCVYGAPDCMDGNQLLSAGCSQTSFTVLTTAAANWYSECSPYGTWDSSLMSSNPPPGGALQVPTFTDGTTPLNGITIYLPSTSSGITLHGNGGQNGDVYLAAPNPCPGTGTYTPGSLPAVSMPPGSTAGVFTYGSAYQTANLGLPHSTEPAAAGTLYPSYDFSLLAECNSTNLVWANEMLKPQHLHFLFYDLSPSAQLINGATGEQWTGIIYTPKAAVTVNGSNKGSGGPPWIDGQIISYDATFSGTSYNDVSYRPCAPGSNSCGSGVGTQLVQ